MYTMSTRVLAVSLLNPALAIGFVQENPHFSWMGKDIGYLVHIGGNMFFAGIAIFFALNCWKEYNR